MVRSWAASPWGCDIGGRETRGSMSAPVYGAEKYFPQRCAAPYSDVENGQVAKSDLQPSTDSSDLGARSEAPGLYPGLCLVDSRPRHE